MEGLPSYFCWTCKKRGIKLWRFAQTSDFGLCCATCAGQIHEMTPDGKVPSSIAPGHKTDQLDKSRVPAVPKTDLECEAYWGYSSVPKEDVIWWKNLPNE